MLVPGCLLVAGVILIVHLRDRERDRALGEQRAVATVRLQASLLFAELETIVSTARYLNEDPSVAGFLSGTMPRETVERRFETFCSTLERYDQIRLLDLEGSEVVRVDRRLGSVRSVPIAELQSKSDRYYFRKAIALGPDEFYLSRFDLNVENGEVEIPWKPVVRLATPAVNRHGEVAGVLVVNYLGSGLLDRLRRASASSPCPTYLVDQQGFFLVGPNESRSWGFMFGKEQTFAADHERAWTALAEPSTTKYVGTSGLYVQEPIEGFSSGVLGGSDLNLRVMAHLPRELLFAGSRRSLAGLILVGVSVCALLFLAAWRLAYAGALRSRHEVELEFSRRSLRNLSAQLLEAQEQERLRISRDLHDEVGQLATAVSIQLKRARSSRDDAERASLIEASLIGTANLLQEMHRISSSLRSSVLDDIGLETAIRAHVETLQDELPFDLRLDLRARDREIDSHVGIHAYRIVQEALTNVIRHADARSVSVRTWVEQGLLHVVVEDDGRGFDPYASEESRLGIVGMRERADIFGGDLKIRSEAGSGTSIHAEFPLEGQDVRDESRVGVV